MRLLTMVGLVLAAAGAFAAIGAVTHLAPPMLYRPRRWRGRR